IGVGASCTILAQDTEPQYAPVKWKLGDTRTVEHVATAHVTRNDSVLLSTEVKSRYRLKVLAVKDTAYEVEFQDITINDKVKMKSDAGDMRAMEAMLGRLITDIQEKMRGFKYTLLVDRTNAQALAVKNKKAMAKYMEETVMVVLSAITDEAKVQLGLKERKELELKLKEYMKEQMPAAMQTVVNCFNYIFQGYTAAYVPGRTHTNDVGMYYVDAIKYGDKESTASQVVTAKQTADKLTLNVVVNEDQRMAYQLSIVDEGLGDQVPFSKFSSVQGFNTVFDRTTTWITRHEATVEVKAAGLYSLQKEVSVLKQ
ncbi:MAG TPA: hypothetical protein PK760_04735, partial [Flavobacteriales bacterium]|nr:hypothetical protein [Flavobacteriales bacterium]